MQRRITMKKCHNCGAVQGDDRTTCIDCDSALGRPISKAEEKRIDESIDDKLDSMAERTEDFYVPIYDKIMGVLCIIGIIAAIILINLCGIEEQQIENDIPEGVSVVQSSGSIIIMSDGNSSEYVFPSARSHTLDQAQMYAVLSIVGLIGAVPMLFFPKIMWLIHTLKYRLLYNWDTTPSYFALVIRKAATYILFAIGGGSVIFAYSLYF